MSWMSMQGITPISEVGIPKAITIDLMMERACQRRIAKGCPRCAGTVSFRTVGFAGVGRPWGTLFLLR
jgi:hypothetical protein